MGGIVSKLFGRGYKLNDPGLSTDDTTIKEKAGHSKEGGKSSKQHGKAPRPPRPSSKVEAPKQEEPQKPSQPSPAEFAAAVAAGLIEKAISSEKTPSPEKSPAESEKPKEAKPEPVSEPTSAYQPVVDVLKSTAEVAAREASDAFQKALAGEQKATEAEPVKQKEEEKLPEPPPAPYQPVVDVLKSTAEAAAREASEAFEKAFAGEKKVVEPVTKNEEEKLPEPPPVPYQPVADVLKTSGEVAASVAGEIFEKVVSLVEDKPKGAEEPKKPEPVQEPEPVEPEQKPFIDVVKDTASEITSNVVSGLIDSFSAEPSETPTQAPKEPPKEAPPPLPKDEPDQEPEQPLIDVLRSTATIAASDFLNKWTSNEDDSQKQEEKKDVEEKPKEREESPLVDVLKSSTRAAVSFASGLLADAPSTEEPTSEKQTQKETPDVKSEPEQHGILQEVTDMARAEAEAVAAKLVEEVKAKAEEQVQRMMAGKENVEEPVEYLSIPDSGKRQQGDERHRIPTPTDIESAVVKIQAGVRGYLTRKMLHEKLPQHHDEAATHYGSQEHASTPKTTVSNSNGLVKESHDSRLQDTQDEKGEERQASFLDTMSERVVDELAHLDPHYTEMAATKIQAAFRGYKVRKELKPDNGPHALHKSEVAH